MYGSASIQHDYTTVTPFADISANHPFYEYVMKSKKNGYVTGAASLNFNPDSPLIRQDMARMFQPAR